MKGSLQQRLRVVGYAMAMAQTLRRPLLVVWAREDDQECSCSLRQQLTPEGPHTKQPFALLEKNLNLHELPRNTRKYDFHAARRLHRHVNARGLLYLRSDVPGWSFIGEPGDLAPRPVKNSHGPIYRQIDATGWLYIPNPQPQLQLARIKLGTLPNLINARNYSSHSKLPRPQIPNTMPPACRNESSVICDSCRPELRRCVRRKRRRFLRGRDGFKSRAEAD